MKQRIRHLLSVLLVCAMVLSLLPVSAFATGGSGSGLTADDPMVVPTKGLEISGSILKGISQDWLNDNKPTDGSTFYIKVEVSNSITELGDGYGGFCLGPEYNLQMDFSNATSLKKIKNQAFMNATALHEAIDLSHTKVSEIGKSAFSGCSNLTGIILPDTLEVLGTSDGGSGSVFNGCSSLQFVRTSSSEEDTIFELPANLKVIGKQTFKNAFDSSAAIIGNIPASVEIIGSEAFYSKAFSQLTLERSVDDGSFSKYANNAFKYGNTGLVIFKNAAVANSDIALDSGSNYARQVYPVTLHFIDSAGHEIRTAYKLWKQSASRRYFRNRNH